MTARPRAAIVATGSELVRGERTDRNGPFLAAEALRHGLEPARITIVGDNPAELEAALRDGLEADACFVSGGLGPTHDDRTVEMIARAAGLELVVDAELEEQIGAVSRAVAERLRRPYADFEAGVRKQATRPAPAVSIGLAGTAPGLVFRAPNGCVVVVSARTAARAAAALAERARERAGAGASGDDDAAGAPRPAPVRPQRVQRLRERSRRLGETATASK